MKKILFLLLFIMSIYVYSQDTLTYVTQQDWKIENSNDWGSFYWKVIRSENKVDGYYYYYIYLYSNSLFNILDDNDEYKRALTYITDFSIYMYDDVFYKDKFYKEYVICDYDLRSDQYVTTFYSESSDCNFRIYYSSVTPFDYSLKK